MNTIWLEKDDIVYYMSSLNFLWESFHSFLTIGSLFLARQVDFFGEPKSLSRLKKQLILKHDVSEVRFLF